MNEKIISISYTEIEKEMDATQIQRLINLKFTEIICLIGLRVNAHKAITFSLDIEQEGPMLDRRKVLATYIHVYE